MTGNWLTAFLVLAVLLHVGMGIRTAVMLRRQGTPTATAWLAGLVAWPLVRRIARDASDEGREEDEGGGTLG